MSAITPSQHLESPISQTSQPATGNRFSQRKWKLLKPQETLFENLIKLMMAHVGCLVVTGALYGVRGLSLNSYDALNQVSNTNFIAAMFTGVSAFCAYGYFIKSNKEKAANITPEMKIAIRNQITAIRERGVLEVLQEENSE